MPPKKKKKAFSIFRLGENIEKVSVQKMQASD